MRWGPRRTGGMSVLLGKGFLLLLLLLCAFREAGEAASPCKIVLSTPSMHGLIARCCSMRGGGRGEDFSDDYSDEAKRYGTLRRRSREGEWSEEETQRSFKRSRRGPREAGLGAAGSVDLDEWGVNGPRQAERDDVDRYLQEEQLTNVDKQERRYSHDAVHVDDVGEVNVTSSKNASSRSTPERMGRGKILDPQVMAAVKKGLRTGELKTLKKGFGFIRLDQLADEPKVDIFFEFCDQNLYNLKGLMAGGKVQFILDYGPGNLLRAYNVQKFVNQSEVDPVVKEMVANDLPTSFAGRLPRHLM
eukprot:747904-Hanusia_phi.AAC.4